MEMLRKKLSVPNKIFLLICLMYFITYVDRVNIATAAPFIKEDLNLTNAQIGLALSAFAYPYALFQIFGGWIGDRFGPRLTLGIVGIVWAVSTAMTGWAGGLLSLFVARLALGFGEGAAFPTATRAMSSWVREDRRGIAQGITHSFSRLGNAIAPPVIAFIIVASGWREAFWILGAITIIWVIFWFWYFKDNPRDHAKITQTDLNVLPLHVSDKKTGKNPVPWRALSKKILPVTIVDFCYGWTLWVYLTWLPSFLYDGYGLDIKSSALFSGGILFAGVVGDSVGGFFSDWLLKRTKNLKVARRTNLLIGLIGSLIFLLPTLFVHNLVLIAVSLSAAFFFLELTNAVLWAIPMDIAPRHAGTASGMMNTGFGISGMLSPLLFGYLVDATGGWTVPFIASVVLLFVGAVVSLRIDPTKGIDMIQDDKVDSSHLTGS